MAKPNKNAKEMLDWFLGIFNCKELRYLPDNVLANVLANNTEIYEEYIKEYPDLKLDSLREFFETYLADRKFLSQDFTPDSIAQLMTEILLLDKNEGVPEVLDEAAGIGCLIIPYWRYNPDVKVYAREFSATTIPFLLFNLAVRNMQGVVICGDTLSLETFAVYVLNKGEKYSAVKEFDYFNEVGTLSAVGLLNILYAWSPKRIEKLTVNEFDINEIIKTTDPFFIIKAIEKFYPEKLKYERP